MSVSSKLSTVRRKAEEYPEVVIIGGAVLVVVGFKVGHAKPKAKVNKEFARRMTKALEYFENGELRSGDFLYDQAYTDGVWQATKRFRELLDAAKIVK